MSHICDNCIIMQVQADHNEVIEPGSSIAIERMLTQTREVVQIKSIRSIEICINGQLLIHFTIAKEATSQMSSFLRDCAGSRNLGR